MTHNPLNEGGGVQLCAIVEDLTNQIQKDAFSIICIDAAAGIKLQWSREYIYSFFNWDSLHARLNYDYKAWSYKKKKHKKIKAYRNLLTKNLQSIGVC